MSFHQLIKPITDNRFARFLLQELGGSGIPRVAFGASTQERMDQVFQQGFEEIGSYGGSYAFSKLIKNTLFHKSTPLSQQEQQWQNIGVAVGTLPMLAGGNFAVMFLRNYCTSKLFQTHDFSSIVGLKKEETPPKASAVSPVAATPKQEASDALLEGRLPDTAALHERQAYEGRQLQRAGVSLGLSATLASIGSGLALKGFHNNSPLPRWMTQPFKLPFAKTPTTAYHLLSFDKGNIENISGLQMFASFGTFAYMGQIASARGPIERFEAWTRYGWYGIANMVIPSMLGKTFQPWLEQQVKDPLHRQNYDFLMKMGVGALLYAAPTAILALATRQKRFDKLQAKQQQTQTQETQAPAGIGRLNIEEKAVLQQVKPSLIKPPITDAPAPPLEAQRRVPPSRWQLTPLGSATSI